MLTTLCALPHPLCIHLSQALHLACHLPLCRYDIKQPIPHQLSRQIALGYNTLAYTDVGDQQRNAMRATAKQVNASADGLKID